MRESRMREMRRAPERLEANYQLPYAEEHGRYTTVSFPSSSSSSSSRRTRGPSVQYPEDRLQQRQEQYRKEIEMYENFVPQASGYVYAQNAIVDEVLDQEPGDEYAKKIAINKVKMY